MQHLHEEPVKRHIRVMIERVEKSLAPSGIWTHNLLATGHLFYHWAELFFVEKLFKNGRKNLMIVSHFRARTL